jgi:branched-subunit amino acid transport protein AzlD
MGTLLVTLVNKLMSALTVALAAAIALLPNTPFEVLNNSVISDYMGYINWVIPIGSMINILTAWCVAIALYYVVQIAMRWAKAIE